MNSKPAKTLILVMVIVGLIVIAAQQVFSNGGASIFPNPPTELSMAKLEESVASNRVKSNPVVSWQQNNITGQLVDGNKFHTLAPLVDASGSAPLQALFRENKVNWQIESAPVSSTVFSILSMIAFPLMIIAVLYFLILRPAQMGGNQAMSFGRSKAKRVGDTGPKITFDDVAGIEEAKQELFEIVDFLKNTKKYAALGAKIPKGILLTGPPGVGKTYLARAIAGEAGVPFFHISGSDFVEMFVGVGAARVRDLFETAKAHRPSLIFVDEIDAVGRQRGAGLGGGHDEREQTLNQLLVEMDGFEPNSGVILIAATNRPDVLDPALLRPGRFDRQIVVDAPDQLGRHQILTVHSKGKPLEADIDMEVLAKRTSGFTGADLANMLNEGALLAARKGQSKISQPDLEEALDRTITGPERKSRIIDAKEKEVLAYHEAGHALIGELLEHSDPVHKITILPRGMSLGSAMFLPEQDSYMQSENELLDRITTALGGRVAEEVVYGEIWTGAVSDLKHVTRIARAMVCEYGMSAKLGTLAIGHRSHNPFLGRDYQEDRNYSEDIARQIDEEVKLIVDRCHQRATDVLTTNREKLDAIVKALFERETLARHEFLAVIAGEPLPEIKFPKETTTTAPSGEGAAKPSKQGSMAPPRLEPGTA